MIKLKKRLDPFKVMPICLGLIGTNFKEKAVTVAGILRNGHNWNTVEKKLFYSQDLKI